MLNIAFRADGGKNIGMGHIMRCLSLARAFKEKGHKVYFFSTLDEGVEKVRQDNFDVIRLPSAKQETEGFFYGNPAHLTDEARNIIRLLHKYQIDVLLIDAYNVSEKYFLALKPHVSRLVYIDDVNKFPYPVDVVINGNITGEYLGYRKYSEKQIFLLGLRYNMIRAEFSNLPPRVVKKKVEEIMITTGGADPYNTTCKLLNTLLSTVQLNRLRFNVLVGSGFTNCRDLVELRKRHNNVFLYANSVLAESFPDIVYSEVSSIMLRSDLAISAGGSTLYELAACGTPAMAVILADNQEFIVRKMDELGYVKSLGWYDRLDNVLVANTVNDMVNNYQERKEMSSKGQRLLDGKGTERIVNVLTS